MKISGYFFRVGSSTRVDAQLNCIDEMYQLFINDDELLRSGSVHELTVSDRVGDIARKIYWQDQSLFESTQNDDIDRVLQQTKHKGETSGILHKLEKSTRLVVVGVIATAVFSMLFFLYGLPATAKFVAKKMPVRTAEIISDGAMDAMDKYFFDESSLSEEQQAKWQAQFDSVIAKVPNEGFRFKLHFRGMLGLPNAMALPGGDIVVTDAFIELLDDPGEFDAVLLHEVGHVVERHGLTQAVQASAMTVILAMAVGDASGVGELIVSVPVFLMQSNYSRNAESGADEYSFKHLVELGVDPKHFATIILKLTDETLEDLSETQNNEDEEANGYLSSHPGGKSRAKRAMQLSKEFNGGQTTIN
ncbi:MAG: M48 family metallopeptidase [Granulosicoccaceae bacterium]